MVLGPIGVYSVLNILLPRGFLEICLLFPSQLCFLFSLFSDSSFFLSLSNFNFGLFTSSLLSLLSLTGTGGFGLKFPFLFVIVLDLLLKSFLLASFLFQLGFQVLHLSVDGLSSGGFFLGGLASLPWNALLWFVGFIDSKLLFTDLSFLLLLKDFLSTRSQRDARFVFSNLYGLSLGQFPVQFNLFHTDFL